MLQYFCSYNTAYFKEWNFTSTPCIMFSYFNKFLLFKYEAIVICKTSNGSKNYSKIEYGKEE